MNKKQKAYTLSLIIPVYNEENYIGACLDSIASQSVKPFEVIVVDNNSTDKTVVIAESYGFVKIIKEKRQHQSYAQHTGFDSAGGDIIGRIDADTVLPKDWVKNILASFAANPKLLAASGSGRAYDVIFPGLGQFFFNLYFNISNLFAGRRLMWGSNCVFLRSVWPKIKPELTLSRGIWEDYDLGFCLAKYGLIGRMKDNDVLISYRSIRKSPAQVISYQMRCIRTFSLHRNQTVTLLFAIAWSSLLLLAPLVAVEQYVMEPLKHTYLGKALRQQISLIFGVPN